MSGASSSSRPTQAVIFAGGLGMRLRPFTETKPKPMYPFHGKPFLEYLLVQLKEQGFERVLLLLGYLPDAVTGHFGDGKRWGLDVSYSTTAVENETGRRLRLAEPLLDERFLLLYSDNYWPLDMEKHWRRYQALGAPAMITAYENKDGYTRDNLSVDKKGLVSHYDKSRSASGLKGVDIGYAIVEKATLSLMPDVNESFEKAVFPKLAADGRLGAFTTSHRYYSIGSTERLPATEAFLARKPCVLIDRDGVLNEKRPRAQYVKTWADWKWLPGALEALALFAKAGWRVALVSNQAGIGRGEMTEADLAAVHARMKADVAAAGGRIDAIYHCPHDWEDGCDCRKPAPGMLLRAQRDLHLDLSRVAFIGDDERDGQAAEAGGCAFLRVDDSSSLLDQARRLLGKKDSLTKVS